MIAAYGSSVSTLLRALDDKKGKIWSTGLKGSSKSFLTHILRERLEETLVVVTPTITEAKAFWNDLAVFLGEEDSNESLGHPKSLLYPPWDTFPLATATLSPSPDIICQRLEVLYSLSRRFKPVIVTTVPALMQRVIPKDILEDALEHISTGEEIDRDGLIQKMVEGSYNHVPVVEEKGEFSIRGGILDIFPPFVEDPIRLEFFGDQVESIRQFDVISQRSLKTLNEIVILPVREVIFNDTTIDYAIKKIRDRADENNVPRSMRDTLTDEIRNSLTFPGVDFYLPFFYPELNTFFDYLPPNTVLLVSEQWEIEKEGYIYEDKTKKGRQISGKEKVCYPEVHELYLTPNEVNSNLDRFQTIFLESHNIQEPFSPHIGFCTEGNDDIRTESVSLRSEEGILNAFSERILVWLEEGCEIFLICHTRSQVNRLLELLKGYDLPVEFDSEPSFFSHTIEAGAYKQIPRISIRLGGLLSGFRWPQARIILITEEEIFGERKRRRPRAKSREDCRISIFGELEINDYVVHIDHGVGLYLGLRKLAIDGMEGDYVLIEYLGDDKLYLPVTRLNLLQKYTGVKDLSIKLDKLGGQAWQRKRKKVKESIKQMAKGLLKLYAVRDVQRGFGFSKSDRYYREFEAAFQYEETPDQLEAIENVIRDMEDEKPMDRLICGDVGFGKTEVALRASFKAVMDGKQVAVLVPTTILAHQHYQTFMERFKPYPVFVDMLSRFKTRKEQKAILDKLEKGEIDIVIGTQRLLQKDVVFRDLGFLVIDEEHRFGVSHKERLKKLKALVDVITMTATPIPRTLNMSLSGLRDLSVINTPPEDRLAISTYLAKFDDNIIRSAILREIERKGQVFFVHNRVETIPAMVKYLKQLIPDVRIGVAHGQMAEGDLEKIMMSFFNKEIDLLVCTTIIESGLDFPSANTIIMNRADKLGLAQMHQLRGRVGRSKEQAYAYLLVPGKHLVSKDSIKRLKALSEHSELGSGLRLAAHDLEIRGSGNILGAAQSGHIATVGYDMYIQLLEKTIKELKGEEITCEIQPEINIKVPSFIPDNYIEDTNQRLLVYKRLASIISDEEREEMRGELIDRYGKIPPSVDNLLEVVGIRILLKKFLITHVDYNGTDIILSFDSKAEVSLEKVVELVTIDQERFKFSPDLKLRIRFNDGNWKSILDEIKNILN